jgi:hypothetical protein
MAIDGISPPVVKPSPSPRPIKGKVEPLPHLLCSIVLPHPLLTSTCAVPLPAARSSSSSVSTSSASSRPPSPPAPPARGSHAQGPSFPRRTKAGTTPSARARDPIRLRPTRANSAVPSSPTSPW